MKKIFFLTIVILIIPILIVGFREKNKIVNKLKYGLVSNTTIKVKRLKKDSIEEIPLEEYVIGVVAGEMPATFNIEALKAQAVASRTYALKRIKKDNLYDVEDSTKNQVFLDNIDLKEKWKNNYKKNLSIIKSAVNSTKGEVILYDNKIIDAMFFSTSNGYTENSEEVFKNSIPYLVSVESSWDKEESPVFSSTTEISKSAFLFNLGLENTNYIKIEDIKYSQGRRIKELKINGKSFEGSKIRSVFNLKSTDFMIEIEEDKVIFNVNGSGHGVGMSQYGANGMAKEGYNYKQILSHYYRNSEIKKIN